MESQPFMMENSWRMQICVIALHAVLGLLMRSNLLPSAQASLIFSDHHNEWNMALACHLYTWCWHTSLYFHFQPSSNHNRCLGTWAWRPTGIACHKLWSAQQSWVVHSQVSGRGHCQLSTCREIMSIWKKERKKYLATAYCFQICFQAKDKDIILWCVSGTEIGN